MRRETELVELEVAERLRNSRTQAASMSLPVAISHRLDVLVEAAEDVNTTRAEIIGLLIAEADLDPEELERRILRYRKMTVGDVIPNLSEKLVETQALGEGNLIAFERRRPGRPGRKAG